MPSNKVSLSCYSTSHGFLQDIRQYILPSKNGLADKMLMLYISVKLDQSPMKKVNHLFKRIHVEHHADELAKKEFWAYSRRRQQKNKAKALKNLQKIALTQNLHYVTANSKYIKLSKK